MIRKMKLEDDFPIIFSRARNSAIGIELIEPKTTIDHLATKLNTGNKRSKGKLSSNVNAHEETELVDSRLTKKVPRKEIKLRYWK